MPDPKIDWIQIRHEPNVWTFVNPAHIAEVVVRKIPAATGNPAVDHHAATAEDQYITSFRVLGADMEYDVRQTDREETILGDLGINTDGIFDDAAAAGRKRTHARKLK